MLGMHFTTELCPSSHSSKCSSLRSSQGSSLCFVEPLYPALGPPDTVLVLLTLRQYLPFTLCMLALAILFILGILKVPNYHVLETIKQDFFFKCPKFLISGSSLLSTSDLYVSLLTIDKWIRTSSLSST